MIKNIYIMKTKSVEPISKDSILWSDLYKFSMMWAIIKNFPRSEGEIYVHR